MNYKSRELSNVIWNLAGFLILLIPLLKYYNIPGLSIGYEILLLSLVFVLLFLIRLLCNNCKDSCCSGLNRARSSFAFFAVWACLVTIVYEVFTSVNLNNPAASYTVFAFFAMVEGILVILLLMSYPVNPHSFLKLYEWIVFFLIVVYCFQWVLVLFGLKLSFKLPFHEYAPAWSSMEEKAFGMQFAPSSLFSEKSHLCHYLIPYIAICLCAKEIYRRSFFKALLVTVIVLSTVSGTGVMGVAIVWIYFFILTGKRSYKRVIISLFGLGLVVLSFLLLKQIPEFNQMFSILFSDNSGGAYYYNKADYRIYRGFDIFWRLDWIKKIIGVGFKHMSIVATQDDIVSIFDRAGVAYEYFCTMAQILLYFGAIGMILFAKHIIHLYKGREAVSKCLIVIMIALFFSSQMLFDNNHLMYMAIIICTINYFHEEKKLE